MNKCGHPTIFFRNNSKFLTRKHHPIQAALRSARSSSQWCPAITIMIVNNGIRLNLNLKYKKKSKIPENGSSTRPPCSRSSLSQLKIGFGREECRLWNKGVHSVVHCEIIVHLFSSCWCALWYISNVKLLTGVGWKGWKGANSTTKKN